MPNHITNVLRVTAYKHRGAEPAQVDELLAAIRTDKSPFDFGRIIPMPAELLITSGSHTYDALAHTDWYQWSVENWGTKWNAYTVTAGKTDDGEAFLHFETAWSPPLPVLDALAARFPSLNFRLQWVDEGDDVCHLVYWADGKRESDE